MSTNALPDPETTEAEAITVPTEGVLEKIDDDNPFKPVVEQMRDDDESWKQIYDHAADAYNPIDKAAFDESFVNIPEFEIQTVVHDEQSTSGERYETLTHADESKQAAIDWAEERHDVIRVEGAEKVDMVTVG